jgi:probable HAF family extracellular repeat protein
MAVLLRSLSICLAAAASVATAQTYTFTDLGTLGGSISSASGMDNRGQVVGHAYTTGNSAPRATLWDGSTTPTDLGTLGGSYSTANGINDSGQAVGSSTLAGDREYHATLWNGATLIDLGTLGGLYSGAFAINNAGQVVGSSYITGNRERHATLWNGTVATDLNSLVDASTASASWSLTDAFAITDGGCIVGAAFNTITRQYHAYIAAPGGRHAACQASEGRGRRTRQGPAGWLR